MTQQQLESVIWRATIMCLGLDPDSEDESVHKRVRKSWPISDTGNSDWGRDENVVFLRITPGYDDYGSLHDIEHVYDRQADTQKEVVSYHRSHSIGWICYGPGSDADADTIRIGILREPVKAYLAANNIAIKPHIREPVRVPEQDKTGEWWERCDLNAEAYQLVTREYQESFMEGTPTINIPQE